ncbi:unnamed protein product [Moneuplotes crassus]|uniref:Uncharacterized protein n=1 Tax=Euplotes crassus TaxID=5936 RepID=A0AAD1XYS8_EUPCR|nr:unnamed protein product [Moneuplotes crassus]
MFFFILNIVTFIRQFINFVLGTADCSTSGFQDSYCKIFGKNSFGVIIYPTITMLTYGGIFVVGMITWTKNFHVFWVERLFYLAFVGINFEVINLIVFYIVTVQKVDLSILILIAQILFTIYHLNVIYSLLLEEEYRYRRQRMIDHRYHKFNTTRVIQIFD